MNQPSTRTRWGALAGIAFFVLTVARIILSPEWGNPGDGAATIARLVAEHRDGVLVDAWAGGLSAVLLVAFAVALCGALRRAGAPGELTAVAFGAAVAVLAVSSASHVLQATLAYGAPAANDPAVTQALFDAARMTDAATWFPLALFAGAAGIAGLRARVLSRGLAAAGVGVAALGLAASAAMASQGPLELGGPVAVLALMATVLWVLLAGVGLLRGGAARRRPSAEPVRVA